MASSSEQAGRDAETAEPNGSAKGAINTDDTLMFEAEGLSDSLAVVRQLQSLSETPTLVMANSSFDSHQTFFGSRQLDGKGRSSQDSEGDEESGRGNSSGAGPGTATRFAHRYELEALVGVGGMGSVYRARDLELDERIALKVLRREKINAPGVLKRFRQEVKLARRITHRNIARMFDLGEFDGDKYLTMEFIPGDTLAAMLDKQGRLSVPTVLEIGLGICEGLTAAHSADVLHRDLKPENVMVQPDGRVVITDFGIAWPLFEQGAKDSSSTLAGTPTYMAPEQVEDRPLSPRTDLYALGEILYELVVGEAPWQHTEMGALLLMRLHGPVPDPSERRLDLPNGVRQLIMQLMATNPDERPASARIVTEALSFELSQIERMGSSDGAHALSPGQSPAGLGNGSPERTSHSHGSSPQGFRLPLVSQRQQNSQRSVAVLPLRNLGDGQDVYLAEGLTEDLIDSLSMVPELRVHSRHVTRQLSQTDGDPLSLGRQLGVNSVLDGTLRRIGDQFRLSLRLSCTQDGIQIWARRYDVPGGELLVLSERVANEVTQMLQGTQTETSRQPITDPRAIELYLKARHFYHGSWANIAIQSVELFAQAHRLAPHDPLLMAGYALSLGRRFAGQDWVTDQKEVCRSLAERALALSPNLAEAHMALAWLYLNGGDHQGAAQSLRRALRSAPGLADAHDLAGQLLLEIGETHDGMSMLKAAMALEPRLTHSRRHFARVYALTGSVDDALAELDPLLTMPEHMSAAWMVLCRILMWHRMADKALEYLTLLQTTDFVMRTRVKAILYMVAGRPPVMSMLFDVEGSARSVNDSFRIRSFLHQLCTEMFLLVNDEDRAMYHLQQADQSMLLDLLWFEHCPLLKQLSERPEFERIHRRFQDRREQTLRGLSDPTR